MMEKTNDLKQMSLAELWQLFPITLVTHRAEWEQWADEEMDLLTILLAEFHPVIHHIGSTSIPAIKSKPIVDLLVEIPSGTDFSKVKAVMEDNGYIFMAEKSCRMSFNKGYTPQGYAERVFHIHIHCYGDNDEIRFRDYLNEHIAVARGYEALKTRLLHECNGNRDAYTDAKSPFVKDTLSRSFKDEFGQRLTLTRIKRLALWVEENPGNRATVWQLVHSTHRRASVNALWMLTHLPESATGWLQSLQREMIEMLLAETDIAKRRILIQLLREQHYDYFPDRLYDFCLSKINSECEPYAIRCFSMYTAMKICETYPDLIPEVEQYLELLSYQELSPGLKSALRQSRNRIKQIRRHKCS